MEVLCNCQCPRVRELTCILPAGHSGNHESRPYSGSRAGHWWTGVNHGVQTWTNGQDRKR
jgi:hypothetical protein